MAADGDGDALLDWRVPRRAWVSSLGRTVLVAGLATGAVLVLGGAYGLAPLVGWVAGIDQVRSRRLVLDRRGLTFTGTGWTQRVPWTAVEQVGPEGLVVLVHGGPQVWDLRHLLDAERHRELVGLLRVHRPDLDPSCVRWQQWRESGRTVRRRRLVCAAVLLALAVLVATSDDPGLPPTLACLVLAVLCLRLPSLRSVLVGEGGVVAGRGGGVRTVRWQDAEAVHDGRITARVFVERAPDTGITISRDSDVRSRSARRRTVDLRRYLDPQRRAVLDDLLARHRPDLVGDRG